MANFIYGLITGAGASVLVFIYLNAITADKVDRAEDRIRDGAGKARGLVARIKAFFGK